VKFEMHIDINSTERLYKTIYLPRPMETQEQRIIHEFMLQAASQTTSFSRLLPSSRLMSMKPSADEARWLVAALEKAKSELAETTSQWMDVKTHTCLICSDVPGVPVSLSPCKGCNLQTWDVHASTVKYAGCSVRSVFCKACLDAFFEAHKPPATRTEKKRHFVCDNVYKLRELTRMPYQVEAEMIRRADANRLVPPPCTRCNVQCATRRQLAEHECLI
jgi:hypothetical protein